MRKDSPNNTVAGRLAGRRQWLHLMDRHKWQRLTGPLQVNLMDRHRGSLAARLQGKA